MDIKYPNIKVKLSGQDGNAFMIMGLVNRALTKAGVPKEIREEFQKEAMSGSYDNLLQTAVKWVDVS